MKENTCKRSSPLVAVETAWDAVPAEGSLQAPLFVVSGEGRRTPCPAGPDPGSSEDPGSWAGPCCKHSCVFILHTEQQHFSEEEAPNHPDRQRRPWRETYNVNCKPWPVWLCWLNTVPFTERSPVRSWHMSRFRVPSPVAVHMGSNQLMFFFHIGVSLSLLSSFCKNQ